jgi:hypothetical protein
VSLRPYLKTQRQVLLADRGFMAKLGGQKKSK